MDPYCNNIISMHSRNAFQPKATSASWNFNYGPAGTAICFYGLNAPQGGTGPTESNSFFLKALVQQSAPSTVLWSVMEPTEPPLKLGFVTIIVSLVLTPVTTSHTNTITSSSNTNNNKRQCVTFETEQTL